MVQLKYTWLISKDVISVTGGDVFGVFKVKEASADKLVLWNEDSSVDLSVDSTLDLAAKMKFRVADDATNLRFYPKIDYEILTRVQTPITTVIRNMVTHMAPGASYTVTLTMNVPMPAPSGIIIEEHYPAGWTASLLNNGTGVPATISGGFKWLFFGSGVQTQTITYNVNVPAGASGTATFSGQVNDGITQSNINGTSSVTIGGVPGDTDGNGKVDDLELLAYIEQWAIGNVSDLDLLAAIEIWAGA